MSRGPDRMGGMRATTIHGTRDIRVTDVPDPTIQAPTDAIVRVVAGCICGSDLWPYRGENDITPGETIGHECVGWSRRSAPTCRRSGPATS